MTLLVLMALCAYRITRLLTADAILDRPRDFVTRHASGKLDYFATCPHCVSVYVSAVVVAATDRYVSVPLPVLMWGATAGAVSVLASVAGALDD